jgi:hypothetical protein
MPELFEVVRWRLTRCIHGVALVDLADRNFVVILWPDVLRRVLGIGNRNLKVVYIGRGLDRGNRGLERALRPRRYANRG